MKCTAEITLDGAVCILIFVVSRTASNINVTTSTILDAAILVLPIAGVHRLCH
jgi:hypothetical protein